MNLAYKQLLPIWPTTIYQKS
uniref:Uncharacterized protein n=1 Tax=Anguilla anguilla TaxID=7936 RepID=A0A0E9QX68_ANGAN